METSVDPTLAASSTRSGARPLLVAAALVSLLGLTACSSIGYRCPLDPSEKPDSPTACAGMHEAMLGAKKGTGGRTSVFLDDQGRIVPSEVIEGRAARPIVGSLQTPRNRYTAPSGQPVFQNPKVFQVWSSSFVDANGNLHDGHHAWFATPGRWNDSAVNASHHVGKNIMRPSTPNDFPSGRIVPTDRYGVPVGGLNQPAQYQPVTQPSATAQHSSKQALEVLGQSASAPYRQVAPQSAAGVTAPAVTLGN